MSGLILHLSISQSHVFLLNSRLGHFSASRLFIGRPFSRSYRSNLPSSLATDHSSTLGFSPRLPVSVCGTGTMYLMLRGFSRKYVQGLYPLARRLMVLSGFITRRLLTRRYNYAFQRTIPSVRGPYTPSSPLRSTRWYWNVDQLSIRISRLAELPLGPD